MSIDDALPHCDAMLHPVVYLCQTIDLPLHFRFRPSPDGPVSQDLRRDLAEYRERPDHYAKLTNGRDLFPGYSRYVDQVRTLKSRTPRAAEILPWMRTAAIIHHTSDTDRVPYAAVANDMKRRHPELAHLTYPALDAMAVCGFMPRCERPHGPHLADVFATLAITTMGAVPPSWVAGYPARVASRLPTDSTLRQ